MAIARKGSVVLAASRAAAVQESAAASAAVADVLGVTASAKVIELHQGLFAVTIGASADPVTTVSGIDLPSTHLACPPVPGLDIFPAIPGAGGWIGPAGGTAVVRIPVHSLPLIVTTYRTAGQPATPVQIQLARLGAVAPPATAEPEIGPGIQLELLVRVERTGELRAAAGAWAGEPGSRRRIEAFSLRPLERLAPGDIEYKAFGPDGRETPWVGDAKLCGSKTGDVPLVGFAIRLTDAAESHYDVLYQGAFFGSGESEIRRNGVACVAGLPDAPLEAIVVRLAERRAAAKR